MFEIKTPLASGVFQKDELTSKQIDKETIR